MGWGGGGDTVSVEAGTQNVFAGSVDAFVLETNRRQQQITRTSLLRTFLRLIFEYFCVLPRSEVSEVRAVFLCEKKEDW